ncbi:GNAT family N-acetyltransferase [Halomonas kenyensis]|uniref:GNAT family N-acetyltransferase n=1 Tax=Billgrantia kenyensis TaxID=321266 RepID=A0A7V9W1J2_9GAMM|nr:GNAT family N-acetyltransferase [Halomonas kenyensis]MBA2779315.1 GNAT family N-acetyltransferase [Halomonas kenyensis]MCG6662537.1 GNAT family N-acetyltransferase [Halomonas kenyensis]
MDVRVKRRLRLRPATTRDQPLLERWSFQPHVEAASPNTSCSSRLEQPPGWRQRFIGELDRHPIGYIQLTEPARENRGASWAEEGDARRNIDLWIGEPGYLGQGYGSTMLQLALAHCFSDLRITTVWLDPPADNHHAHRFCERLGFRFIEQRRLGESHSRSYCMERRDWLG